MCVCVCVCVFVDKNWAQKCVSITSYKFQFNTLVDSLYTHTHTHTFSRPEGETGTLQTDAMHGMAITTLAIIALSVAYELWRFFHPDSRDIKLSLKR